MDFWFWRGFRRAQSNRVTTEHPLNGAHFFRSVAVSVTILPRLLAVLPLAVFLGGCASDSGCSTQSVATTSSPAALAEFYVYKGRTLGIPVFIYDKKDDHLTLLGRCGAFGRLDARQRFEVAPGAHEFLIAHGESQWPLTLWVEDGMITPVRITLRETSSRPLGDRARNWRVKYTIEMTREPRVAITK